MMHLWKAGDLVRVDDYLETRGLRRNALFHQLLQALISLLLPAVRSVRSWRASATTLPPAPPQRKSDSAICSAPRMLDDTRSRSRAELNFANVASSGTP